ncbi:MAG: septal ring lytic transglycosylase RlpA family protein [bacterium]
MRRRAPWRRQAGWWWVSLLLLAGCQQTGTLPETSSPRTLPEPQDGPPLSIPPGLANLPDPVPRQEPKSARGNPPTYTVFGKTYRVMDSASGYYASGMASWYGRKFHGRLTSSGEPYDMFELTAAHRSLPIPTYVRVTNLDNRKTTIVRVNDRGPFHTRPHHRSVLRRCGRAGVRRPWHGAGARRSPGGGHPLRAAGRCLP